MDDENVNICIDELVERARHDAKACEILAECAVKHYLGPLTKYFRYFFEEVGDAEQSAIDVIFGAVVGLPRFRGDCSFNVYVWKLAANKKADYVRKKCGRSKRAGPRRVQVPLDAASDSDRGRSASAIESKIIVDEVLSTLDQDRRTLIYRHGIEGETFPELEKQYASAKNRTFQAMKSLRKEVDDETL